MIFFEKVNIKHEQNVVKSGFHVLCKWREVQANQKGHLTELQKAVHVDNFRKMTFNLRNS